MNKPKIVQFQVVPPVVGMPKERIFVLLDDGRMMAAIADDDGKVAHWTPIDTDAAAACFEEKDEDEDDLELNAAIDQAQDRMQRPHPLMFHERKRIVKTIVPILKRKTYTEESLEEVIAALDLLGMIHWRSEWNP